MNGERIKGGGEVRGLDELVLKNLKREEHSVKGVGEEEGRNENIYSELQEC